MKKLALILVVVTGCAGMGSMGDSKSATMSEQEKARSDYQKAADAQKRATEEQGKSEQAQRDVVAAEKSVADAQARARGQQARAEQAQVDARKISAQAQQQAEQAQQQAVQSQSAQTVEHKQVLSEAKKWTDEKTVNGQVLEVKDSSLRLRTNDSQNLTLGLSDATSINIDGRLGSAANVQPGSDVRASYQLVDGKAQALSLDVRSGKSQDDSTQSAPQPPTDSSPN